MEHVNEFRTHDFYISSLLKTLGFPLLKLERINGKFVDFIFDDPEQKAQETISRYWNREIKVVARDLVETINELKTRIHT